MTDLTANTEAEVVEIVRSAREWKSPLNIVGARTKRRFGRAVAGWGTVLDLSGLTGIVSYEPEELLLTVLPGTSVAEIGELLGANHQRLGFEPPDWVSLLGTYDKMATIGGAIAADTYGAASLRYGRARDHLLGFRAVNGFGEAYKGGGRVVKNVTGFDLPKLMCGSMGTLGVLTEVTLRVFPSPARLAVFEIPALGFPEAVRLMHRVSTSPVEPTCLGYAPESAARELPGLTANSVLVRLEGSPAHLDEQNAILRALVDGRVIAESEDGGAIIAALCDGMPFHCNSLGVWRVSIAPSRAPAFIAEIDPPMWYADRAGGLLWVGVKGGAGMHDLAAKYQASAIQIRPEDNEAASAAPFPPEPPARAALTRAVKAAFDPLGLFNPGRMYEGI